MCENMKNYSFKVRAFLFWGIIFLFLEVFLGSYNVQIVSEYWHLGRMNWVCLVASNNKFASL